MTRLNFLFLHFRLLNNNKLEGSIPLEIENLDQLMEMQFDVNLTPAVAEAGCINRKVGHW